MEFRPRYKPGDKIGGYYTVINMAVGGMSEVYFCLRNNVMPVALKTPKIGFFDKNKLEEAFLSEVSTWIELGRHPNIVTCDFLDRYDDRHFLQLEWIMGEDIWHVDLRSRLPQKPLPLTKALQYAIDICAGLIHVNKIQPGVVHRDLKPENILIARDGVAKITDFGLATLAQKASLKTKDAGLENGRQNIIGDNGIVGTPPYMAPEQWVLSEQLDSRVDIYAIGCILYEMLAGTRPFEVSQCNSMTWNNWLEMWRRKHNEEIPAPLPTSVPSALSDIIFKCLAKRPERRFGSAIELQNELIKVFLQNSSTSPRIGLPVTEPNAYDNYNRGQTYYSLRRYEEAVIAFTRVIEISPEMAEAYTRRGLTFAVLRKYSESISDHTRAMNLDPNNDLTISFRGASLEMMGKWEDALRDYLHAISINPDAHHVYEKLGTLYYKMGRYTDALETFDQAYRTSPTCAHTLISRAQVKREMGLFEGALTDLDQAIHLLPYDSSTYVELGETYRLMHKHGEAIENFEKALQISSNDAAALAHRGATYRDLGEIEHAFTDFDHAIELDPENNWAIAERGLTFHQLQQYDNALADLSNALVINPSDTWALSVRAQTFQFLHRYREALDDIQEAVRLKPANTEYKMIRSAIYWQTGLYDKALNDFSTCIAYIPVNSRNPGELIAQLVGLYRQSTDANESDTARFTLGNLFLQLGLADEALIEYERCIQLSPKYLLAHYQIATIYKQKRNDEKASFHLRRIIELANVAIELDPRKCDTFYFRGLANRDLRLFSDAIYDFTRAIQIDPTYMDAYYGRAQTYESLRRYDDALDDYTQLVKFIPDNISFWIDRGAVLRILNRLEESVTNYSRAIDIDQTNALVFNNRGNAYHDLERYNEAIADRTRALELDPKYSLAYFNRGNSYKELERNEEALADYTQAIAFSPGYVEAYFNRSVVFTNLLRYEEAIADLKQVIALNPDFTRAYLEIGLILFDCGDYQEALNYFDRAARAGEKYAAVLSVVLRNRLGNKSEADIDYTALSFLAVQHANSLADMNSIVRRHPIVGTHAFLALLDDVIRNNLPIDTKRFFEKRVLWIRQIIETQTEKRD